jgi:hypothetical protein
LLTKVFKKPTLYLNGLPAQPGPQQTHVRFGDVGRPGRMTLMAQSRCQTARSNDWCRHRPPCSRTAWLGRLPWFTASAPRMRQSQRCTPAWRGARAGNAVRVTSSERQSRRSANPITGRRATARRHSSLAGSCGRSRALLAQTQSAMIGPGQSDLRINRFSIGRLQASGVHSASLT